MPPVLSADTNTHVPMYRYNKTAADIVCDNAKSSSAALRDEMSNLMKGKYGYTLREETQWSMYCDVVQPMTPISRDALFHKVVSVPIPEVAQKHSCNNIV